MSELFDQAVFLKYLASLLAIFNPLYGIPTFLAMTEGFEPHERRRTAIIVAIAATAFATICVLGGEELLGIFGIDLPSFRIAGGLILIGIGFRMLNAEPPTQGDQTAIDHGHKKPNRNIAIVPLTIPLTVGPGVLAVTIVFAHELSDGAEIVTMIPVVLIACAISGLGLIFANPISKTLGPTVINVATRIMAIILIAVSVEMVLTGAFNAIDAHYPHLMENISG